MARAQAEFSRAVAEAPFSDPSIPLVGNVNASPLNTADEIRADLRAQLTSRVRWTESVQEMARLGVTTFVEIGSGSVLVGLVKRIDEQANGIVLGKPADFEKLQEPGA
jgi:[acyl-carrier-protein] S-malonyltransferase